jgi:hypothetical protein
MEASFARLEQDIVISFYAIRKLLESQKLTVSVSRIQVPVRSHKPIGRVPDLMSWHRPDEHYDIEMYKCRSVDLIFLCNQLIHSYILCFDFDKEGVLCGVFVTSDRNRKRELLWLDIEDLIKSIMAVGDDFSTTWYHKRGDDGQLRVLNFRDEDGARAFFRDSKDSFWANEKRELLEGRPRE